MPSLLCPLVPAAAQYLKHIALASSVLGSQMSFYLAAAVSDFYIPWSDMVRHLGGAALGASLSGQTDAQAVFFHVTGASPADRTHPHTAPATIALLQPSSVQCTHCCGSLQGLADVPLALHVCAGGAQDPEFGRTPGAAAAQGGVSRGVGAQGVCRWLGVRCYCCVHAVHDPSRLHHGATRMPGTAPCLDHQERVGE
jgi:hypothetical protein